MQVISAHDQLCIFTSQGDPTEPLELRRRLKYGIPLTAGINREPSMLMVI